MVSRKPQAPHGDELNPELSFSFRGKELPTNPFGGKRYPILKLKVCSFSNKDDAKRKLLINVSLFQLALRVKYTSAVMQTPASRKKFNMFPRPKYLKIMNMVTPVALINPLLELIKIIENVKNSEKNTTKKNNGSAPRCCGLVK